MLFNFNFFEGVVCNFPACCRVSSSINDMSEVDGGTSRDVNSADTHIVNVATKHNITILPVYGKEMSGGDSNLYPVSNHVDTWNTFVVGSDKTYILANVNNPLTHVPNHEYLQNHKGDNILPPEMHQFFDAVWDKTLLNNTMHLFVAWNEQLFRVNSFPLVSELGVVVGAVMFMKTFDHTNYVPGQEAVTSIVQRQNIGRQTTRKKLFELK
jgi:hypothetical protein